MLEPVETFPSGEHAVVHRLPIGGYDSVLKLVDAYKDPAGEAILRAEARCYLSLRQLWGSAIPALVFFGPVNRGRYALATLYGGASLAAGARARGKEREAVRKTARAALRALHEAGWLHGDVAPRNLVKHERGKVLLIDLGNACELVDLRSPDEARAVEGAGGHL